MDRAFGLALHRAAWTVTPTLTTKLRNSARKGCNPFVRTVYLLSTTTWAAHLAGIRRTVASIRGFLPSGV